MSNQAGSRSVRQKVNGIAAHVRSASLAFSCQVEELSTEGAFLRTDRLLSAGAEVEINLAKPRGRKLIHTLARVLRACGRLDPEHAHPGLDVNFTSIANEDSGRLISWLEELADRPAPSGFAATAQLPAKPLAGAKDVEPALFPAASLEQPPEHAKLMLQVRGLLLEMDDLRASMRMRDEEIEQLRRQLEVAEQLIGKRTKS